MFNATKSDYICFCKANAERQNLLETIQLNNQKIYKWKLNANTSESYWTVT